MTIMRHAVFLIDLNQDVAASRPIAKFIRQEFPLAISFIVSAQFRNRDVNGIWFSELEEITHEIGADLVAVETVSDAVAYLFGKDGVLFSASESMLDGHHFNHAVFLATPPSFTRVTLQHGLECIGFNHNRSHDEMWRHYLGLGCDIAASWFHPDVLHSVRPDQRAKLFHAGPLLGLDHAPSRPKASWKAAGKPAIHGLICENLHSVRFDSDSKTLFVDTLKLFAHQLKSIGGTAELRPHPGGRYLEKNTVELPANIRFNRLPLYKQSLGKFSFCISGPSSVLLDLVWAGVPVAVWTSGKSNMDIGIYARLHVVSDEVEWLEFALAATRDPRPFLEAQADFLASFGIPDDIPAAYHALIQLASGIDAPSLPRKRRAERAIAT